MRKTRDRFAFAAATLALVLVSCAGQSHDLGQDGGISQIDCLVTLPSYCCEGTESEPCIATFAEAEQCSSWSTTKLSVYATPCQGLTAVRLTEVGYSMLYVYDSSGALYAIGDNAASDDPTSAAVECGAGPSKYVIPSACAQVWIDGQGSACTAGTATPGSICQ